MFRKNVRVSSGQHLFVEDALEGEPIEGGLEQIRSGQLVSEGTASNVGSTGHIYIYIYIYPPAPLGPQAAKMSVAVFQSPS